MRRAEPYLTTPSGKRIATGPPRAPRYRTLSHLEQVATGLLFERVRDLHTPLVRRAATNDRS